MHNTIIKYHILFIIGLALSITSNAGKNNFTHSSSNLGPPLNSPEGQQRLFESEQDFSIETCLWYFQLEKTSDLETVLRTVKNRLEEMDTKLTKNPFSIPPNDIRMLEEEVEKRTRVVFNYFNININLLKHPMEE